MEPDRWEKVPAPVEQWVNVNPEKMKRTRHRLVADSDEVAGVEASVAALVVEEEAAVSVSWWFVA